MAFTGVTDARGPALQPTASHASETIQLKWAEVVAQLVEQSLLIPEVPSSNPVIGKTFYTEPLTVQRQK